MPPASVPLMWVAPSRAPLSLGDGGAWSTARDLLRRAQAMNDDALGVAALLQTPGTLDHGQPLDYAWGIGVRTHADHRTYRHGGGWTGLRVLLARIPDLSICLAVIAAADHTDRHVALADALLDELTREPPRARNLSSTSPPVAAHAGRRTRRHADPDAGREQLRPLPVGSWVQRGPWAGFRSTHRAACPSAGTELNSALHRFGSA